MKIGEIDYNLKLPKKSLFLCKPNKSTIAKINEAYDVQYYTKLSTVNELSFKIPTIIIKDDVPMDNPNIERIKHRYIFKYVVGNAVEYFLFNESNKSYSDEDYIEYKAYSLGVQLGDKNIREYEKIGNLKDVAEGVLEDVYGSLGEVPIKRWTIGYVDSYFTTSDTAERKYTVSSMSLLEVIYDIATKWNAVIKWNTQDLVIDFYRPENVGLNKGFYIRDGKYLESFDLSIDSSSTVTRLRAFGSDGLTFRGINPLGEDYIQDFSFYMYPFEYDKENNKVIKSSDYMSDSLCIALSKYEDLVKSLDSDFEVISKKIVALQEIFTIESDRLSKITVERILLEDERDVLLAEFQKDKNKWGTGGFNDSGTKEGTQEHAEIIEKLRAKEAEESAQQTVVDNAKFDLEDAEREKQIHLDKLKPSINFSNDEWAELQEFIIVQEYTNDSITRPKDLLKEAKTVFKQNQEPKIKLSVSLIDFLSVIECQNDWDKLGLGDSIRIRYDRLKVNILAKIIEINYDFENFEISLTIANEKDLKDGSDMLMDLLNKADLTSTIVSMDKDGWNLSKENNGKINDIINNKWDSLKNAVLAGYDQQITISERGIIVKSLDDPDSWLVIQNGFLAITNDKGNTWKHAISKDGIWGEYIFGKLISGVNLYIEDESGAWKTQGSRTTIYNADGKEVMWLGLVSDNLRDKFDNIIRQEEGECFGLKSWNTVTKVEVTDCVGFAISRWKDDAWQKVMWANTDGTLYTKHMVAEGIKIVNDIGDLILDAENNIFNIAKLDKIVADGKLTTLEKLQIVTDLHSIHADYKALLAHAEKYNKSDRDNLTDINGQWDALKGSFPTIESTTERFSTQPLIDAYTALVNYLAQFIPITEKGIDRDKNLDIDQQDPLMETTSEITDRGYFIQVFRDYHDQSVKLKQAIEDSIFYSGINMGKYYNNLIMNDFGFIAVRNDGRYRAYLNATNGLALQKWEKGKWVSKLFATLGDPMWEDGTLFAEGLVTKNLRIVDAHMNEKITFDWYKGITIYGDNNGAIIYLNANDAIKIEVNGDRKFWVGLDGRLYAKDITTHNLKIVDGNLGEKIVFDHEKGISIYGDNADIFLNANDAIRIKTKSGEDRFWVDTDGNLFAKKLYIMGNDDKMIEDIDGSYISDLTVNSLKTLGRGNTKQDIIHIAKNFMRFNTFFSGAEKTKLEFTYEGTGDTSYPVAIFGAGNGKSYGSGSEQAKIYKDNTKFAIEYDAPSGRMTKFYFNQTDTDDEGQAVYFESKGGVRFHSDKKFVAKTDLYEFFRVVKGQDAKMQFGQYSWISIEKDNLLIRFDTNNYIKISASGVEVKGTKISLN
ncbi:phage tail spike protein [Lysinibacillus xylanilyticus]|uniref:phage tail spike protein n=1 Tax=Lysinibacillus xylanilyticus TaxID=582475 RepID=UPI00381D98A2